MLPEMWPGEAEWLARWCDQQQTLYRTYWPVNAIFGRQDRENLDRIATLLRGSKERG